MIARFRHSLRWQIQFYYTTLVVVILAVLAAGSYHYEKRLRIESIDNELAANMLPLMPRMFTTVMGMTRSGPAGRRDGPGSRPPPVLREAVADIPTLRGRLQEDAFYRKLTGHSYVVMFDLDGKLLFSSANAPADPEFQPYIREGEVQTVLWRWSGGNREAIHPGPRGLQIILGVSGETLNAELRQLAVNLALIALGTAAVFTVTGWLLLDRGLRPIQTISETARRISDGDLQGRIPAERIQNELGPLAALLNTTFGRLDESLQSQRRFNADASHELRTPLAIIMADCDYSLKRERPPERYLKTIRTCREAAEHMAVLVEDLNLLAKADASALRLKKEPGDLAVLLREVSELTAPLAQAKALELSTELASAPTVFDAKLMRQVCVNLIGNAVTYNRPQGHILLRTGRVVGAVGAADRAFVEIEDTGVGIAAEDLPHIFDRFYRADKARGHVRGKTGLGLAITHTILEAHGGTISVRSELGVGTCFRLELPGLS